MAKPMYIQQIITQPAKLVQVLVDNNKLQQGVEDDNDWTSNTGSPKTLTPNCAALSPENNNKNKNMKINMNLIPGSITRNYEKEEIKKKIVTIAIEDYNAFDDKRFYYFNEKNLVKFVNCKFNNFYLPMEVKIIINLLM